MPLPPSLTSSLSKQICVVVVFLSVCTCVCICCFVALIALGRQSAPSLSEPPAHSAFSRVYPPFFLQIHSLTTFSQYVLYICSLLITVGRPNCLICPVPGILSRHLHFFQLYLLNIILWKREIFLLWLFRTQNQDLEKTKGKRFTKMFSPIKRPPLPRLQLGRDLNFHQLYSHQKKIFPFYHNINKTKSPQK